MKQLLTCFLLILSSISIAGTGNPERNKLNSQKLASDIYQAYQFYKAKDSDKCKSIMQNLNLNIVKDVLHNVSKSATVDSLVFENNQDKFWGYLKSVDLSYLRNIEVVFAVQVEDTHSLITAL